MTERVRDVSIVDAVRTPIGAIGAGWPASGRTTWLRRSSEPSWTACRRWRRSASNDVFPGYAKGVGQGTALVLVAA